jgi:hypothetical protein
MAPTNRLTHEYKKKPAEIIAPSGRGSLGLLKTAK